MSQLQLAGEVPEAKTTNRGKSAGSLKALEEYRQRNLQKREELRKEQPKAYDVQTSKAPQNEAPVPTQSSGGSAPSEPVRRGRGRNQYDSDPKASHRSLPPLATPTPKRPTPSHSRYYEESDGYDSDYSDEYEQPPRRQAPQRYRPPPSRKRYRDDESDVEDTSEEERHDIRDDIRRARMNHRMPKYQQPVPMPYMYPPMPYYGNMYPAPPPAPPIHNAPLMGNDLFHNALAKQVEAPGYQRDPREAYARIMEKLTEVDRTSAISKFLRESLNQPQR